MHKTGDEKSILRRACIDLIVHTKRELINSTTDDFFNHESPNDFPVIPFDEFTLVCTTSTKGNEEVEIDVTYGAFTVPFPVSV